MRTFLFLFIGMNLAFAQPMPLCKSGPNNGRALACTALLQQEWTPNKRAAIYKNRAQAYTWSRQLDLAVKDYDAALAIDPNDDEALYFRGSVFENMQRHDRAVADTDRIIALGKERSCCAVYQLRCRALAGLGRFEEAISACTEQLRPYASDVFLVDRGEVYILAGQHDHAMEDFDAALKIDKNNGFAILGRGKVLLAKQNYLAALEEFDKANRVMAAVSGQDWGMALSKRGRANEALGRKAAAVADFQVALKMQADLAEAKDGLKRLGASSTAIPEKPWWHFW